MKKLITLLLCLIAYGLQAQNINILYNLRYETFSMDQLKALQLSQVRQFPVTPALLENMPSGFFGSLSLEYELTPRIILGINPGYSSTGSRYYYEDFSGFLSSDFLVNRYDLMLSGMVKGEDRWVTPFARLEAGANFSEFEINLRSQVGDATTAQSILFQSVALATRFGVGVEKKVKFMLFRLTGMYEIVIPSALKLKENTELQLRDATGTGIGAQWDGLKVLASVGVSF